MSLRKRINREEPIPQVAAQKREHPKHSSRYSKKRNERFSIQALATPPAPKRKEQT